MLTKNTATSVELGVSFTCEVLRQMKQVIQGDNVEGLQNMLENHGVPGSEDGYQLLKASGEHDSVGCLEFLLGVGVSPEYRSPGRLPILTLTVLRGSEKCFNLLVDKGVYCEQTVWVLLMDDNVDWLKRMLDRCSLDTSLLKNLTTLSLVLGKDKVHQYLRHIQSGYSKLSLKKIQNYVGEVSYVDLVYKVISRLKTGISQLERSLEGGVDMESYLKRNFEKKDMEVLGLFMGVLTPTN